MDILQQKGFSMALEKAVKDLKQDALERGCDRDLEFNNFIWAFEDYSKKMCERENKVHLPSRKERYEYLNQVNWEEKKETNLSSVYFLISHGDTIEPILFQKIDDWWLEYDCQLMKAPCKKEELSSYIKDYYLDTDMETALAFAKTMHRGEWFYKIENFQSEPFLPEEITILKILTGAECLDWLLEHERDKI